MAQPQKSAQNRLDLSASDLATLGVQSVAFIKPVMIGGTAAYAIHAADGEQLAIAADRASAIATVVQNELEPASVH